MYPLCKLSIHPENPIYFAYSFYTNNTPIALSLNGRPLKHHIHTQWGSVDLKRGLVRVEAVKSKNGTSRTVPINSVVREILQSLKDDRLKPTGHVFLNRLGKPYQGHTVSQQFTKAVRDAGIDDFCFHDLRHTFASRLADRGAELLDLARLLGHKTIQVVMRYAHLTDRRLQMHVDLLTQPDNIVSRKQMDTIWTPGPFYDQKFNLKYIT